MEKHEGFQKKFYQNRQQFKSNLIVYKKDQTGYRQILKASNFH